MTTITTGIDLVEIERFRSLNPAIKKRFLNRVFTTQELSDCAGKDQSLAGRFAAKEAAAKALGCGIGEVKWQDIEIQMDEQKKPVLVLHGKASEISTARGWSSWSVSIAHTAEHAVASVTALIEKEP
ncbi:MAG: holo-ACP synthase [Anaerolineaceae bacterium]|nr:holo-ACP synthase [Anaerolineaceae bacterium]